MIEVIETNISFSYIKEIPEFYINIKDHQSRIVKISDWKSYVSFYSDIYNKELRKLYPDTLPVWAEILNLKHDGHHLSCIINNGTFLTYRLVCLKEK